MGSEYMEHDDYYFPQFVNYPPGRWVGYLDWHYTVNRQRLRFEPLLKLDSQMKHGDSALPFSRSDVASPKTFLLIDGDQAILDCVSLLLEARGHRVCCGFGSSGDASYESTCPRDRLSNYRLFDFRLQRFEAIEPISFNRLETSRRSM